MTTPLRRSLPWIGMAATAIAGFFAARAMSRGVVDAPPTVRFEFTVPEGWRTSGTVPAFAISPDGRFIAYNALNPKGDRELCLRRIDQLQSRPLGVVNAVLPTFSADGKWLAFANGTKLLKIAVDGGAPIPLADLAEPPQGLDWGLIDRIIVGAAGGLLSVPAVGGAPKRLTSTDTAHGELEQRWPRVLTDGKTIVYTSWRGATGMARLAIASIDGGPSKVLDLFGTAPLGVVDGDLVYGSATRQVMAVPFDIRGQKPTGTPVPVVDQVLVNGTGSMNAALGGDGSLMYGSGGGSGQLVLADQHNATHAVDDGIRDYAFPRLSPNGKRIAVSISGPAGFDVWIFDGASRTLDKLTTAGAANVMPEWSPDGRTILFQCDGGAGAGLCIQPADFSGSAKVLVADASDGAFTPDGRSIVFRRHGDLYYRAIEGDTTPKPIVVSPALERAPRVSPDGRWIAYSSDESATNQVYVRPFPGPGARYQVSTSGGFTPVWSRDGHRLFYIPSGRSIVAATFTSTSGFVVTRRDTVFTGLLGTNTNHPNYDVTPDGAHVLIVAPSETARWIVAHNWRAELRARMGK
jgi:eukaryotic-like serine/threonine-protein kinase